MSLDRELYHVESAQWNPQHHQVILATDPIAYWLQDEKQGTVAYDWVRKSQGSDQNGAYTGVTLGQPGIGDGRTAPFFDGVNDFNDVFTLTFQGRFDDSEGTLALWIRVANAGVWIDGLTRTFFGLRADGANELRIYKAGANNRVAWLYEAGGVVLGRGYTFVVPPLDWFFMALTWSVAANQVRTYLDGVEIGVPLVGLGVWAGLLANTDCVIGALNTVPAQPWHGYLAHAAVWGRPLPPNEVWDLYRGAFV